MGKFKFQHEQQGTLFGYKVHQFHGVNSRGDVVVELMISEMKYTNEGTMGDIFDYLLTADFFLEGDTVIDLDKETNSFRFLLEDLDMFNLRVVEYIPNSIDYNY